LIIWGGESLAPHKVPQYIEFSNVVPKSKVGNVLRREIREEKERKTTGIKSGQKV
jgi:long-chain acyl-CoA synthetase